MNKQTIEKQALSVVLIPILILGVVLESYFIYTRSEDLNRSMLERSKLIAHQLASSSEYAVFSGNRGLLRQQVEMASAQQDVHSIVVLDASGKYLIGSGISRDEAAVFEAMSKRGELPALTESRRDLTLYQPILASQIELDDSSAKPSEGMNKSLGGIVLVVSKQQLNNEKLQMFMLNLLLSILVLGFSIVVAMRVARRITLPIMDMLGAVRNIGKGRVHASIGETRVQELDELARGINEMAEQLQEQRETLQQRIEESTQELRVKKEEAEKANFDKTRFLAAASHDLRQPMHALGLFMGELHNRINTPEQRLIVNKVEESVEAMSGLLDSLLDISKLDAGVVVPQEQHISMSLMLKRLAEDFSSIAEKKHVTLRVHAIDAHVMSDPVLLERILINLLSNAVRYVHAQGAVMLACRRRGDHLRIEVRDNGPGIPLDEQQNIFREFVQLSNQARDRSKGLGLGLAIVDRLSKLLKYPLYLRSAPNKGSTFAIEIPRVPDVQELLADAAPAQATVRNVQVEFAGLRVLVVDDDALVRNGTAGLLASWGSYVEVAENLSEATHKISDSDFDLIVCDYRLPDGNGLELAESLSKYVQGKPAFILISGDTSPDILQQVVEMGHHLMHKPVRPAKLRSMMSFVLKKHIRGYR